MVQVDLNPLRAAMKLDLEDNDYTQPALIEPLRREGGQITLVRRTDRLAVKA
jgi:hypothetical protein